MSRLPACKKVKRSLALCAGDIGRVFKSQFDLPAMRRDSNSGPPQDPTHPLSVGKDCKIRKSNVSLCKPLARVVAVSVGERTIGPFVAPRHLFVYLNRVPVEDIVGHVGS